MANSDSRPFVLVFVTGGGAQKTEVNYESYATEDDAKERFAQLMEETEGEVYVFREHPISAEIDTKPRITFAPNPVDEQPKAKKARKPRADKGQPRKPKEANGHAPEVVS